MNQLLENIYQRGGILGVLLYTLAVLLIVTLIYHLVFSVFRLRFINTYTKSPPLLRRYMYYPGLTLCWLLCVGVTSANLAQQIGDYFYPSLRQLFQIALIINVTILIRRSLTVSREVIFSYYDVSDQEDVETRKIVTQVRVIERVIAFIIIIAAIAFVLMTFEAVQKVGVSLLASAGVIGIVIGFAAQKSIANVVAGIQLAFAQPIRINDVVVVESEWGRIEEVTLTYVTVKLWDERRLVVPLNYFIEKPFQNWTRQNTELTGSIFLYLDYSLPVDELRTYFFELLEREPLWDGRIKALQVTDTSDRSLQIRALMSARNASEAFDLRCKMREELVKFVHENYPQALPKVRTSSENSSSFPTDA